MNKHLSNLSLYLGLATAAITAILNLNSGYALEATALHAAIAFAVMYIVGEINLALFEKWGILTSISGSRQFDKGIKFDALVADEEPESLLTGVPGQIDPELAVRVQPGSPTATNK